MEGFINILPFCIFVFIFFPFALLDISGFRLPAKQEKLLLFTLVMTMTLFGGFRWSTGFGTDYEVYVRIYENPVDIFNFIPEYAFFTAFITKIDAGYVFLSSLFANYISNLPNLFFTVLALLSSVLFYKSLVRNKINNYLFLIIFIFVTRLYFQYPFTMMRQALVMSVLWYSIPLVHDKKIWKFGLICMMCATIHFSAIFFIVVYWLPKFNLSNRTIFISIFVLFVGGITKITDNLIMMTAQSLLPMVGLSSRLGGYLMSETYAKGINLFNFVEIAPFVYWAIKYRVAMSVTKEGKLFFNMIIFYVLFLLLTMNFMALTRISSYFIYSYFYIVAFAFTKFKLQTNRWILGLCIIAYFLIYAIRYILLNFISANYQPFFLHL